MIAAASAVCGAAEAQEASGQNPAVFLQRRVHEGQVIERYVAQVMEPFRRADVDDDGLDAADLEAQRQAREAQERAQHVAQVLRYDLNADLVVEPGEVAKVNGPDRDEKKSRNELERYDVDGDGVVTLKEVLDASARISRVNRARGEDELRAFMSLSEARDGRLTAAELAEAARAAFMMVDADGDGRASRPELEQFQRSLPAEPRKVPVADVYCPMPPALADDLIILFGAYQGVSSPSSSGDRTGLATVHIEPGRQPIYLILPSYKAIRWTLTGAVGRVRQVVVSSSEEGDSQPPRGAAGAPQQRVRVFGARGCVQYFKLGTPQADAAKMAVEHRLGRQPDVVASAYTASDVTLPPKPPGSEPLRQRPEAAGPPMRPGAWRLTDEAGPLTTYVVGAQGVTRLIFRVGSGICTAKFQWRREGPDAWRFRSKCELGTSGQIAEGRAVGDFQTHLAFTAQVRGYGFDDPALNGVTIVRVQGEYVGPS
jgi:Ca2+-binding EF-hand superfamily protein